MTNPFYGSSLFQARKTNHNYRHSHLHDRQLGHDHARSYAEFHKRQEEAEADAASTADLDSAVTEVVQTVSVVQIIDGVGSTIEVQTHSAAPQTYLVDGSTGTTIQVVSDSTSATAAVAPEESASPSTSAATAVSSALAIQVSSTSVSQPGQGISGSLTSALSSSSSASLSVDSISSLSSSVPSFSSIGSVYNSTSSTISSSTFANSSIAANTKVATSSRSSTSLSSLSTSSSSALLSSTTFSSSTASSFSSSESSSTTSIRPSSTSSFLRSSSSSSDAATATDGSWNGDGSSATAASATPTSTGTAAASGGSDGSSTVQTGKVVGGVVGGLAGLAVVIMLAFMFLRWKRRSGGLMRLGEDGGSTSRALEPAPGPGGGSGSGAYGTMGQSGAFTVASSLAALSGKQSTHQQSAPPPEMAERGFVRVSGRKLPPVLQFGGDGYTDPTVRASQASETSVYRDSMAFFSEDPNHRLALGSPMRPVSGVMVMNPGPQRRTPVSEQAHFSLDSPTLPRSSTFPSMDALGRTFPDQDFSGDSRASRGSGTRFTEHM